MRTRLIQYHYESKGNWQKFYESIVKDLPLLEELNKRSLQLPQKYIKNVTEQNFQSNYFITKPVIPKEIQMVTILDKDYPEALKNIYNPPLVLYIMGNKNLLHSNCIAIIGTRNPSEQAYQVVKKIVKPLVDRDLCVVSGMANGIDTYAHLTTMDFNGKTIAVIGGGFYHIYPRSNLNLSKNIASTQMLMSEYPPDVSPRKWRFVERNRIIAGLSVATVVVEAKEKSGTLITAQIALEEGREVFAVPSSILSENAAGCHRLIQEGANLACDGEDILKICKHIL